MSEHEIVLAIIGAAFGAGHGIGKELEARRWRNACGSAKPLRSGYWRAAGLYIVKRWRT